MNLFYEVLGELLGGYKISFYITYFIFVMLGVLVSLRIGSLNRDKSSKSTPEKFSFWFLIQDNFMRVVGSISLVFLAIRFGQEKWDVVPEYYTAAAMGLAFDFVLAKAKKFQDMAREKLK